jgi:hypothetical protein
VGLLLIVPGVVLALVSVSLERRASPLEVPGRVALDEDAVLDRPLA